MYPSALDHGIMTRRSKSRKRPVDSLHLHVVSKYMHTCTSTGSLVEGYLSTYLSIYLSPPIIQPFPNSAFLICSTLHRHACSIGIGISSTLTESDRSIADPIDPFRRR